MNPVGDYLNTYIKQNRKCTVCGAEIAPGEYWAVNTPHGVRVIHGECFENIQIDGCHAQVEILYKPGI